MSTNAKQNVELVNGVRKLENVRWTAEFVLPEVKGKPKLAETGIARFKFVSPKAGNTPYFLVKLRQPDFEIGDKLRIATIFEKQYQSQEDTWMCEQITAALEAKNIDQETGKFSVPIKGQWYDIPLKEPIHWHADANSTSVKSTQGQFVFSGEDLGATITRVQERYAKLAADPTNTDYSVIVTQSQAEMDAEAAALREAENQG